MSPELLRAWERRYGLVSPGRSDGGFRLYSEKDVELLSRMKALVAEGVSPAEAAVLARRTGGRMSAATEAAQPLHEGFAAGLESFDEVVAQAALDRVFGTVSIERALTDVVLPYLRSLGDRWQLGEATIGQEHFASSMIRSRLLSLAGVWDVGVGPLAILACLPGERHELGLVCFGLCLRRRGWRITYLGADTPIESVSATVDATDPGSVVLAGTTPEGFESQRVLLRTLAGRVSLLLAGAGSSSELAEAVGARALLGDPVAAARSL